MMFVKWCLLRGGRELWIFVKVKRYRFLNLVFLPWELLRAWKYSYSLFNYAMPFYICCFWYISSKYCDILSINIYKTPHCYGIQHHLLKFKQNIKNPFLLDKFLPYWCKISVFKPKIPIKRKFSLYLAILYVKRHKLC